MWSITYLLNCIGYDAVDCFQCRCLQWWYTGVHNFPGNYPVAWIRYVLLWKQRSLSMAHNGILGLRKNILAIHRQQQIFTRMLNRLGGQLAWKVAIYDCVIGCVIWLSNYAETKDNNNRCDVRQTAGIAFAQGTVYRFYVTHSSTVPINVKFIREGLKQL